MKKRIRTLSLLITAILTFSTALSACNKGNSEIDTNSASITSENNGGNNDSHVGGGSQGGENSLQSGGSQGGENSPQSGSQGGGNAQSATPLDENIIYENETGDTQVTYYTSEATEHLATNVLHNVSVSAGSEYVVRNNVAEYKIIVPDDMGAKAYAGLGYIQNYLGLAGKCSFETIKDDNVSWSTDSKYIVFGSNKLFTAAGLTLPSEIGSLGVYIKTVGKSVFIMGEDTGLRNGALEFLHHVIGFEPYSKDTIVYNVNDNIVLPVFDITDCPDMDILFNSGAQAHGEISELFRSNGDPFIPVKGKTVHNSLCYLPKDSYKSEHGKWYASNVDQLCYTAHGDSAELKTMQDTLFENMKQYIEEFPNQTVISITQEDGNDWCNCSACTESKKKYGTDAAVVIKFCNTIARKLDAYLAEQAQKNGTKKREITLVFFAYCATGQAPVKLVNGEYQPIDNEVICDDNVGVYYAPIEASFTESFYHDTNESVKKALSSWSKLTKSLYTWLYETNFRNYLYPYATFDAVVESYRCLKTNNAKFIMPQGIFDSNASTGFTVLKDYINSKAAWNVNVNTKELTDAFFANYFMDAAEPMRKYFDEMQAYYKYLAKEYPTIVTGGIYDDINKTSIWPQNMLEKWLTYMNNAYVTIDKYKNADPQLYTKLYDHINLESMSIRYMLLELYSNKYSDSEVKKMRTSFVADAEYLGVTRVAERSGFTDIFATWGY